MSTVFLMVRQKEDVADPAGEALDELQDLARREAVTIGRNGPGEDVTIYELGPVSDVLDEVRHRLNALD